MAELAEGTTLLTWQGVKLLAGSNPALSARYNIQNTWTNIFLYFVTCILYIVNGEMAEWFKATVLKTVVPQGTVSSNLTLSAKNK